MTPGTIALPCGDMARYAASNYCLSETIGMNAGITLSMARGLSIVRNLNEIIRDMKGDWIWFQADDHVYAPSLLPQLEAHDADVIVPLIIRRYPPFSLVIYTGQMEDGGYIPFAYNEVPDEPFEVYAAGTGGMLIRRHVLDAIGDPWFQTRGDEIQNEDLEFCHKIRDAGYSILCDPDAEMGHLGTFAIWPHQIDGHRGPLFKFGESGDGAMNQIFIRPEERDAVAA